MEGEEEVQRRRERQTPRMKRGGKDGWEERVIRGVRDNSKIKD